MLALRSAIRPRLGLNVIPASTRCYRPTPCLLYQIPVESSIWRTRLWYRRDGTPRSKWKGAFYASTTVFIICELMRRRFRQDTEMSSLTNAFHVMAFARMLIVDAEYSSYEFSKMEDVMTYFRKILKCHLILATEAEIEAWDKSFDGIMDGMRVSQDSNPELFRISQQLHELFRDTVENVHSKLKQSKQPRETAEAVQEVVMSSLTLAKMITRRQKVHRISAVEKEVKQLDEENTYDTVE